jgi:carbon monoxide dehydrogenase subunit G
MFVENTIDIQAPAEIIWAVMVDVERWSEWTPSMQRVERLDAGPFAVGSRARVRQPRIPPAIWVVTELVRGSSFTWVSHGLGQHHVATHRIDPRADGRCTVTLSVRSTGSVVTLFSPIMSPIARRYVAMEAEGLKRRAEASVAGQ